MGGLDMNAKTPRTPRQEKETDECFLLPLGSSSWRLGVHPLRNEPKRTQSNPSTMSPDVPSSPPIAHPVPAPREPVLPDEAIVPPATQAPPPRIANRPKEDLVNRISFLGALPAISVIAHAE